jgi:hypothetical protein
MFGQKDWMGIVPKKDDFGKLIEDCFYDGKTKKGPWAIMNPESYIDCAVGLGKGRGQQYMKKDGRWVKVNG